MVKRTQIIRRQRPTNCLGVFDFSVGLSLKELTAIWETFRLLLPELEYIYCQSQMDFDATTKS